MPPDVSDHSDSSHLDQLASIETPAVVVDRALLMQNIARAAERGRASGALLRPHAKTHKSLAIARLQLEAGAVGLTVAKSSEALIFMSAGVPAVTVAHPLVDPRKIQRLLRAASETGCVLRLIADSETGVDAIAAAAADHGAGVEVQIKVDVGLHRCGVDPTSSAALDLARRLTDEPRLSFAGLISHAGHSYSALGPAEVAALAEQERTTMLMVAYRLRISGIPVPAVSVGSTPTVWLAERFEGLTELRPGNYVFMDLTQVSLGVVPREQVALSVLATVVSRNATHAIIDAGSKVLSSDRGPHGSTRVAGYGLARRLDPLGSEDMPVTALSEEHGFVEQGGRSLAVGERVRITPNHACTVANLARELLVLDDNGVESWPVEARAQVL